MRVYKELTVLFKNNPNSEDEFEGGTHKVVFNSASFSISGEYLVVDEYNDETITGQVFRLNTVHSYKVNLENVGE